MTPAVQPSCAPKTLFCNNPVAVVAYVCNGTVDMVVVDNVVLQEVV